MNFDPRKSEYGLVSYSPVKHVEQQALRDEINKFLKNGGEIKHISNNIHADPDYGLFDKRKDELASLARSNRRKFFNFQCPIHGVTKHRTKDMCCVKCIDEKLHDAKLKEIVNKHCGVLHG